MLPSAHSARSAMARVVAAMTPRSAMIWAVAWTMRSRGPRRATASAPGPPRAAASRGSLGGVSVATGSTLALPDVAPDEHGRHHRGQHGEPDRDHERDMGRMGERGPDRLLDGVHDLWRGP